MPIEITQNLNTSYVRLNLGDDDIPRYYVVKKDKADSFSKEYKKQSTKTSILTNTAFLGSIMTGTFLSMLATKSIKNAFARYAINCAGGIAAGLASLPITGKIAKRKEDKIVLKYGAKAE